MRHNSALGNALLTLSVLYPATPAAAKTWGRKEAAVTEHLGGTE